MSWAKLDDRANEHEKQVKAGAKACWLWACGLMFCNRQKKRTGRIPKLQVGTLFPGLGAREAKRLVSAGLWIDAGEYYEVHDYHGWNPGTENLSEVRASAGRKGGIRSGEARRERSNELQATRSKLLPENEASATENRSKKNEAAGSTTNTRIPEEEDPRPDRSEPADSEDDLSPSPNAGRDPLAYMRGDGPTQRVDVKRLHAAWKLAFGYDHHRFRGYSDLDAQTVAEALDAYGEETCHRVLAEAPNDPMVNGTGDDRGTKHDTIRYIFGNSDAFNRILRASEDREQTHTASNGQSMASIMAAARGDECS